MTELQLCTCSSLLTVSPVCVCVRACVRVSRRTDQNHRLLLCPRWTHDLLRHLRVCSTGCCLLPALEDNLPRFQPASFPHPQPHVCGAQRLSFPLFQHIHLEVSEPVLN